MKKKTRSTRAREDTDLGVVIESLAAARFRVRMGDGAEVICYLAGRVKRNKIRIFVHDKVDVVLDPAGGKATNRITWRR